MSENEQPLDLLQMAKYLRVHSSTLRGLIRKGLPAFKVGKQFRFLASDVLAWLQERSAAMLAAQRDA